MPLYWPLSIMLWSSILIFFLRAGYCLPFIQASNQAMILFPKDGYILQSLTSKKWLEKSHRWSTTRAPLVWNVLLVNEAIPPLLQILRWNQAYCVASLMPCLPPTRISTIHNLFIICTCWQTLLAQNYLKNIAITKWKPNLSTGQKRVFCRVIAEQAPDIILKTNNHILRRVKLLLPYFAGLQLFFLWYWKAGFDWLREWAGSSGWWIPRFLRSGFVAKWKRK